MARLTSWIKNNKGKVIGGLLTTGVVVGTAVSLLSSKKKNKTEDSSTTSDTGTGTGDTGGTGSGTGTRSSSSSSSSPTVNRVKHEQAIISKPLVIHVSPKQYSVQRAGLEVYYTDEDSYSQYISPYNEKAVDITKVEVESESSSENSASVFKLHRGQILETYYYGDLLNLNFDEDYVDMSQTGTINREAVNLQQFFKGVRICAMTEWEAPNETLTWDNLEVAIEGFITEQTFKEKNVEIKVEGYTKLFEQQIPFKFQNMYRSEILREIILSAGLQPYINSEGLDDDITNFTNEVKTKASSSSNTPIGESSGNIAELAQQICQGKNTDYAKAQAIHSYIQKHVQYPSPNYSDHKRCPMQVLKTGISNCCDRARLGHEMANAVGLHNRGVHGPNHVWVQYKINGKWVNSDPGTSRPKLGPVYEGMSMDRVWSFPSCK